MSKSARLVTVGGIAVAAMALLAGPARRWGHCEIHSS